MAETLPTVHSVGDVGHTTDHNTFRTAVSDIDVRLSAVEYPAVNAKTASYTLVLGDANEVITMNSASATTLTVPANTTVAFPVSTTVTIINIGAGVLTIAGTASNVKSRGNFVALAGQNGAAVLVKYGTDLWNLSGDLA